MKSDEAVCCQIEEVCMRKGLHYCIAIELYTLKCYDLRRTSIDWHQRSIDYLCTRKSGEVY